MVVAMVGPDELVVGDPECDIYGLLEHEISRSSFPHSPKLSDLSDTFGHARPDVESFSFTFFISPLCWL